MSANHPQVGSFLRRAHIAEQLAPRHALPRLVVMLIAATTLTIGSLRIPRPASARDHNSALPAAIPVLAVDSELSRLLTANSAAESIEDLPTAGFQEHLRADEIVYRQFTDTDLSFQIYVACWRAGNPNAVEAASHLPEACWGLSGWRCDDARTSAVFRFAAATLRPGEWRRFSGSGRQCQEALFWCLVGDRLVPREYRGPQAFARRREGVRELVTGSDFLRHWWDKLPGEKQTHQDSEKQAHQNPIPVPCAHDVYFVRVNSAHPIEAVLASPMFARLHPVFARLGLVADYRNHDLRTR